MSTLGDVAGIAEWVYQELTGRDPKADEAALAQVRQVTLEGAISAALREVQNQAAVLQIPLLLSDVESVARRAYDSFSPPKLPDVPILDVDVEEVP